MDEDNASFVLQIRRPNFWRIELPTSTEEYRTLAAALREAFDNVLQFEKTYCPFQRTFTVELPDEALIPVKKKPWTPKHQPIVHDTLDTPNAPKTPGNSSGEAYEELTTPPGPHGKTGDSTDPSLTSVLEATVTACGANSAIVQLPNPFHKANMLPDRSASHTTTEVASMPSSPRRGSLDNFARVDAVDSSGLMKPDTVAAIVHDIDSRFSRHTASTVEEPVTLPAQSLGKWASGENYPGFKYEEQSLREPKHASLSASAGDAQLSHKDWPSRNSVRSASFSGDLRSFSGVEVTTPQVLRDIVEPPRSPSQDSFTSIDSWHSLTSLGLPSLANFAGPKTRGIASDETSGNLRADSTASIAAATTHDSRFDEHTLSPSVSGKGSSASLLRNADTRVGEPQSIMEMGSYVPTPRTCEGGLSDMTFRSSSRKLSADRHSLSPLPPDNDIARASGSALVESPASPDKAEGLPTMIIAKTCEVLLAPPAHLIALMLKVAVKLSAGEWRGKVHGYNSDGDQIPVHWDYSEDDLSD